MLFFPEHKDFVGPSRLKHPNIVEICGLFMLKQENGAESLFILMLLYESSPRTVASAKFPDKFSRTRLSQHDPRKCPQVLQLTELNCKEPKPPLKTDRPSKARGA